MPKLARRAGVVQQTRLYIMSMRVTSIVTCPMSKRINCKRNDAACLQELDMKVQMEKGFVMRSAKQTRDIKDANSKLLALEKTLQEFVEDFEKERQFMRDQWTKASADMSKEVDGYRRLVDVRVQFSLLCQSCVRQSCSTVAHMH